MAPFRGIFCHRRKHGIVRKGSYFRPPHVLSSHKFNGMMKFKKRQLFSGSIQVGSGKSCRFFHLPKQGDVVSVGISSLQRTSLFLFFREWMRDFHDLLRQDPSSLLKFLDRVSILHFPSTFSSSSSSTSSSSFSNSVVW
jgi:hypothetical protein